MELKKEIMDDIKLELNKLQDLDKKIKMADFFIKKVYNISTEFLEKQKIKIIK